MIAIRRYLSVLRTAFFVFLWSLISVSFIVFGIARREFGYMLIGFSVAIFGSLVTRAPDEDRLEGTFGYFGRFLIGLGAALALVGILRLWLR